MTQAQQLHHRPDLQVGHQKERRGDYLGKTVQVIPARHRRDQGIHPRDREGVDVVIVEIGGTVGDIESLPFLEAIRQLRSTPARRTRSRPPHAGALHPAAGELKTKPTQHSVKKLREIGIQPDILLCRSDRRSPSRADKIALFCNVPPSAVIRRATSTRIYEVPLRMLSPQGLDDKIAESSTSGPRPRPVALGEGRRALKQAPKAR
jgi:CTP synthase